MRGGGCHRSLAPDHPRLRVQRRWGVVKHRRMVRVSGISPPVHLGGFCNDINTLERAVKERVFYVKRGQHYVAPPRPADGHFRAALVDARRALVPLLPSTVPCTRSEFVASFRGRKRKLYESAYTTLLRESMVPKDARLQVFVKYEKTDFTRKTDPVPRVISPRSPRYNIEVGRFLRPLEERVFESIGQLFGHPTVMKGYNSSQSGRILHEKWQHFREPVAVGLDASRFDQHVSEQALQWEHGVYVECFPHQRRKRTLRRLLRHQLKNVCVGFTEDGKLKYSVEGGRMSGDMNTSLGNCLLVCCMVYAYALAQGVRVQLANNGDDCVVFMEARDFDRFSDGLDAWFLAMGFSMQVEPPCYTFEELEFCQTHPVYAGPASDDYLMVRHPKWGLAKDTMCVHAWESPVLFRGWLHAVGTGGLAAVGGLPVLQEFYSAYLRAGKFCPSVDDAQSWGVRQLSRGMTRSYGAVSAASRASFYWAFGVTPDEQLVLEDFYRGVKLDSTLLSEVAFQPDMPL